MNPLLQEFIAESREHIERSAAELSTLESTPGEQEAINALFRAVHTIKGSCRLFPLEPVARLSSAVEDMLDSAREEELVLERHHLDLLLQSFDTLDGWFDQLEQRGELGPGAQGTADTLAAEIRQSTGQPEIEGASQTRVRNDCSWLGDVAEDQRIRLFTQHGSQPLVAILYEPEADCFYAGEDPLYTIRFLPGLVSLDAVPREPWPPLAEFDAYRCRLRFYIFSTAPVDEIEEALRSAQGLVAICAIEPSRLALPRGEPQSNPDAVAAARQGLALLDDGNLAGARETLSALRPQASGWLASSLDWIERLALAPRVNLGALRGLILGIAAERQTLAPVSPHREGDGRSAAARKLLRSQAAMLASSGDGPIPAGRFQSAVAVVLRCARQLGREDLIPTLEKARDEKNAAALKQLIDELQDSPQPPASPAPAAERSAPEDIPAPPPVTTAEQVRIDLYQMDRLMDLVSELVIAKNSLPYLAQQAEAQGHRDFARGLKERYGSIHRIVEEMQATMAAIRLVPLSHGFRRLPRLVRDAARRVGKEVALSLEGQAVEADRRVVDALGEPLVHLLRNAIDHGIEPAEQRQSLGKPRVGQLRVAARAEDGRLAIDISDDGYGVDIEAVKRRAYERGLISEDALGSLSEEAALQLVFQAGFSTRGRVTEMSGRGVGLDVVRTAVQALGGSVALQSKPGAGTRVTLMVPLSMATAEVMMVDCAGQRFGVALHQIVQTLKLPREAVREVKQHRAIVLRRQVIPLLSARNLLDQPEAPGNGVLSILVVRLGGGMAGLEVDGFGDVTEVVMKPLDGVLAGMRQYAGSAVLANGSVLLVLDLPRLVGDAPRA